MRALVIISLGFSIVALLSLLKGGENVTNDKVGHKIDHSEIVTELPPKIELQDSKTSSTHTVEQTKKKSYQKLFQNFENYRSEDLKLMRSSLQDSIEKLDLIPKANRGELSEDDTEVLREILSQQSAIDSVLAMRLLKET